MTTIFGCDTPYANADMVLFGAPFDSTASFRPGSRFAPGAMRMDSAALESYSPYLDADLSDIALHDAGDLSLSIGDTQRTLAQIRDFTSRIIKDKKRPVMLGGEHLVTLGAIEAIHTVHPGVCVIHFDAHTDLRDDYLGVRLSHATVMRRIWDELGDGRIFQFGIRSGTREEFGWANGHVDMHRFDVSGLGQAVQALSDKPVYVSLDLDVLDPSVLPGTGTPEPGGVSFLELLDAVHALRPLNIVGCDICELCPSCDSSGASTAAALKILRELLLTITTPLTGGK